MLLHAEDVLCMNTSRISTLFAIALVVGMFSCYSVAAPELGRASKANAALVDGAYKKKPQAKAAAPAKTPQSKTAAPQANPNCDNSSANQDENNLPIVPIVFSAIGTIAFIVLAIIF